MTLNKIQCKWSHSYWWFIISVCMISDQLKCAESAYFCFCPGWRDVTTQNSDHTTPSAFIWSPAIFVFITHSAVTGTHTAILVTSRHRDERADQSKECQVMLHHQSSVLTNACKCAAAIVERNSPIGRDHALFIVLWRRERSHWSGV